MSSQIEEIAYNQEQSLPDPKRIKLSPTEFETQAIKVKSCTIIDSTGALKNQQVLVLAHFFFFLLNIF
jgi:hypothetical protein